MFESVKPSKLAGGWLSRKLAASACTSWMSFACGGGGSEESSPRSRERAYGIASIGVPREAAFHSAAHDRPQALWQEIQEARRIDRAKRRDGKQAVDRGTEAPGVELSLPELHLLRRIIELDEGAYARRPPACQWSEEAHEVHDALGSAANPGVTIEATLGVGQLHRIDVDRNDLVLGRELHRRTTRGSNAQDPASRPKGFELNRRVFVHAPEEHLPRTDARIEASPLPDRDRRARAHGPAPAGTLAATQARTRKAKFFTSMPRGS